MTELVTDRLLLREFRSSDLDAFRLYVQSEHHWRSTPDGPPTIEQVKHLIRHFVLTQSNDPRAEFHLAAVDKVSNEFVGAVDLVIFARGGRERWDGVLLQIAWVRGWRPKWATPCCSWPLAHWACTGSRRNAAPRIRPLGGSWPSLACARKRSCGTTCWCGANGGRRFRAPFFSLNSGVTILLADTRGIQRKEILIRRYE